MRALICIVIPAVVASACGGRHITPPPPATDDAGPVDAGPVDAGVPYPAPFPAPPQVANSGGPVLGYPDGGGPTLIPVFFTGDDPSIVSGCTDFLNGVGGTTWWHAATSEYGVGTPSATAAVTVDASELTAIESGGNISDSAIQTWLQGKLSGADAGFPAADSSSVYVLHFPANITITIPSFGGQTSASCTTFGGYHSSTNLTNASGINVSYAVIPRCGSFQISATTTLTGLDAVTAAESHEIVEASTDPYPDTNPAYAGVDNADLYWELVLGGGEVGDMCAQNPGSFTKFPDFSYEVQRIWSNKAAMAGADPCVPELAGEVYFNSAPEQADTLPLNFGFSTYSLTGVNLGVGESKTINVDLYSEADTGGPWLVDVQDLSPMIGGQLTLSLNTHSGVNGDVLQLSITNVVTSQYGINLFMVTSTLNGQQNFWIGAVGN
jgi:hypothetical protein